MISRPVYSIRKAECSRRAITGTPGHVNAMAASVNFFLEKFPIRTLCPGDVLLTNDPWHGTGHLNDFTVVTPVFRGDRAIALFAATSHIADVGGLGFGPDGRQVFEEGPEYPHRLPVSARVSPMKSCWKFCAPMCVIPWLPKVICIP